MDHHGEPQYSQRRDHLVRLVRRITDGGGEADELVEEFVAAVPHPRATDLIFWPDYEFDHQPTAEEIVDRALGYRAIEL